MSVCVHTDRIRIEGLDVECIVGLLSHERTASQRLRVDLELVVDTERAATTGALSDTIDYEWLAQLAAFTLKAGRFELLETAAHVLSRLLLLPPADGGAGCRVAEVRVKLRKPGALWGRAVPSLEITRSASELRVVREEKPFGSVDVVWESGPVGIYRLNLAPLSHIPLHVHRVLDEVELVMGSGLLCQGQPAARGSVRRWPRGLAHRYDNPTSAMQSILCVDRPRFSEDDEVVVQGEPGPIESVGVWQLVSRS